MSHEIISDFGQLTPRFTQSQQAQIALRKQSVAGFLDTGGAGYFEETGDQLIFSDTLIKDILVNDTPQKQIEAFSHTAEAQMLEERRAGLLSFKNTLGVQLGYTATLPKTLPIESFATDEVKEVFGFDISEIKKSEMQKNRHLELMQARIAEVIRTTYADTKATLLRTPALRLGAEVKVLRGAKDDQPERWEEGWKFSSIALDGKLVVIHAENGRVISKNLPASVVAENLVTKK